MLLLGIGRFLTPLTCIQCWESWGIQGALPVGLSVPSTVFKEKQAFLVFIMKLICLFFCCFFKTCKDRKLLGLSQDWLQVSEILPPHLQHKHDPEDHVAAFPLSTLQRVRDKCYPGWWAVTHQLCNHCSIFEYR